MAKDSSLSDLTDSLSAPLGDLIAAVGRGVAEAQRALDQTALETYRELAASRDTTTEALMRLGYQPTWYRIPEVEAELTVTLAVSGRNTTAGGGGGGLQVYAAPVDATYVNRYDFDLNASSHVRFKIVPVPPSPQAAEVRVVPDLTGRTLGEAKQILRDMGVAFQVAPAAPAAAGGPAGAVPLDTAFVDPATSEPAPGAFLLAGQVLVLRVK